MKTFVGMAAGPLRLAGFASVNTWFLPEAIRRFRTAHPDVTVTLQQVGPLRCSTRSDAATSMSPC